jgi:hypothetical protein
MASGRLLRLAAGTAGLGVLAAGSIRLADARRAEAAWTHLAGLASSPAHFDPSMVQHLPDPARRWFLHALAPGTPLHRVAEIEMEGQLGLGDAASPRYLPMRARQILAPPHGFVWMPRMGEWPMPISGSDGYAQGRAWTRFWLLGLVPIARAAETPDLARSAAARGIAEAALWLPAALLPGPGVAWEGMDAHHARVTVAHAGGPFPVEIEVRPDGRLASLVMPRWSNANPERVFRWQPFGGTVLETGRFHGATIATRVEAGNHFGTDDYFPFFRARLLAIRFIAAPPSAGSPTATAAAPPATAAGNTSPPPP